MSVPQHYSRDIAQRCETLIHELMPVVQRGVQGDEKFGGRLTTTFLLALSTPMLLLPIERIVKATGRADERSKDQGLTDALLATISRPFSATPFGQNRYWRYVSRYPRFNTARNWPDPLVDSLNKTEALEAACKTSTERILRDLRNALAHGSIAYLDETGYQTGDEAVMLGFAADSDGEATAR